MVSVVDNLSSFAKKPVLRALRLELRLPRSVIGPELSFEFCLFVRIFLLEVIRKLLIISAGMAHHLPRS
jgi:hypothetical protein